MAEHNHGAEHHGADHHAEGEGMLFLHGKPIAGFHESHEHVSPVSLYVKILGALFFLTALTYAVSFADLGPASLPVAMIVAFVKATLVCMYFMHLKYDDKFHVFVFLSTLLFVAIFFVITIFDLTSRNRLNEAQDTFFRTRYDDNWNPGQNVKRASPASAVGHGASKAPDADAKVPGAGDVDTKDAKQAQPAGH